MSVMQESMLPGRVRRRFTKEFKAEAVASVLDGDRSIVSVALADHCGDEMVPGSSSTKHFLASSRPTAPPPAAPAG